MSNQGDAKSPQKSYLESYILNLNLFYLLAIFTLQTVWKFDPNLSFEFLMRTGGV